MGGKREEEGGDLPACLPVGRATLLRHVTTESPCGGHCAPLAAAAAAAAAAAEISHFFAEEGKPRLVRHTHMHCVHRGTSPLEPLIRRKAVPTSRCSVEAPTPFPIGREALVQLYTHAPSPSVRTEISGTWPWSLRRKPTKVYGVHISRLFFHAVL